MNKMLPAITVRMALLCAFTLVSPVRSTEAELTQQRAGAPARSLQAATSEPFQAAGGTSPAHMRAMLELTEEREQILMAQASIADWRRSLARKHGRTRPAGETDEPHHQRRRKKRAEYNDVHPTGGKNGTVGAPDPGSDLDDADDPEASVVCYGPLGCFHETDHLPEMLPSTPAEVNTRFLVYTTTHRSEKPLIEFSYEELVVAGFGAAYWSNGTNDTISIPVSGGMSSSLLKTFGDLHDRTMRVIVHGFGANCGLVWIYEMRTALMAVENCTVICVDWENGAKLPNYVRAAANTRLVGRQLALLLRLLRTHNGLRLGRVHLIGFSLGSHVAGFAGAEFSTTGSATPPPDGRADDRDDQAEDALAAAHGGMLRKRNQPDPGATEESTDLWRITGLDPAGPLFEAQPPEVRLDASDARYVDVIHSNGENLILGGLGSWQPMGTVDYYPNGGRVQHGCTNLFVGAVTDIIWVEGRSLCNHRRAYKFFIDSVAPRCHFPAFPCESYDRFASGACFACGPGRRSNGTSSACGRMGYYATSRDVGGYGQLYLRTRDEEPYCANQFRLRLRNAPDELPLRTVGRFELTLEGGDTGNGIEDGPDGGADTLITFNETFHLDEARDDREFHAGQWLTTILVPHPALGHRPRALTITYRPYRGGWWQRASIGKQLWRIGPILLTADDQRTYGACDTLALQADVPVRLELAQVQLTGAGDASDERDGDDDGDIGDCRVVGPAEGRRAKKKGEGQKLAGDGLPVEEPGPVQPGDHDHFSWTPVAISIPRHPQPPPQPQQQHHHHHHHPHQQPHVNEKRSFSESALQLQRADDSSDAGDPGKLSRGPHDTTGANGLGFEGTVAPPLTPLVGGPAAGTQTVQLFPSRLVSFFERAERYARRTWDALFSGNITGGALPDTPDDATTTASGAPSLPTTTTTTVAVPSSPSSASPSGAVPMTERKIGGGAGDAPVGPSANANSEQAGGTSVPPSSSSTSTEIRIALPTFRPLVRPAATPVADGGGAGTARQHYTRFIPLVYEGGSAGEEAARPMTAANGRPKGGPFTANGREPS